MGSKNLSRRAFVAGQMTAAIAIAGVANAGPLTKSLFERAGPKAPRLSRFDQLKSATWETITNDELSLLIGNHFNALCDDGLHLNLKLVKTEAIKSGRYRPRNLARREGVIAVFESPQANWLSETGHQNVWVSHPVLGDFQIFLGAVPSRSGGHVIEAVLN